MSTKYCCMLMRVAIDCKGCFKKLKRTLLSMKGEVLASQGKAGKILSISNTRIGPTEVETHMIEREFSRVSVCGRFRPSDVAIKIRRRMKRRVEILDIQEFDGDAGGQDQIVPMPHDQQQQPPMANGHIEQN